MFDFKINNEQSDGIGMTPEEILDALDEEMVDCTISLPHVITPKDMRTPLTKLYNSMYNSELIPYAALMARVRTHSDMFDMSLISINTEILQDYLQSVIEDYRAMLLLFPDNASIANRLQEAIDQAEDNNG